MPIFSGTFQWPPPADDEGTTPTVLGWDGRIDNAHDVILQLGNRGRDDSSVRSLIAAAYQRWGVAGLGKIIGDWSVAIHDRARNRVVLASDFAGVRPLYYHHQPGELRWAGSLKALVARMSTDIDEMYVAGFLTLGGYPNRTPYKGVYSVPPGHAVCVTSTQVTAHSFWALPTADTIKYADERRYDEQFRALFREAVAVRLQRDAPVVAELSGGLDSSSVVCLANHLIRRGEVPATVLTTISYLHRDSLDAPFIREVESSCGIEGVHLSIHQSPLASEADAANQVPGDSGPLERSAATTARRLNAKVFLTGQNGDLAMGNWLDDSQQIAAALRRGDVGHACAEALAWSKALNVPVVWILARGVRTLLPSALANGLNSLEPVPLAEGAETSVRPDFMRRIGVDEPSGVFSRDWMQAPPERRKHFKALTVMREMRRLQMPEPMEGLDYTHPFAHRPLVEFVMSIPADVLCKPGEPRKMMRRALAELWPPKLRRRRSKSLFGTPQFEALQPLATRLLSERRWQVAERGWVDQSSLATRLQKLTSGIDCDAWQLRQIILLEYWLRSRDESQQSAAPRPALIPSVMSST